MKIATASDYFSEIISDIQVKAAVFTTYALEIDFFETEIIPLLLASQQTFSNDVRIKELQIREELVQSKIAIDLFYDAYLFEQERNNSIRTMPGMEYGFYGVYHANGAFHAKMILVLGIDQGGEEKLVLLNGSCNLTKAGWWDNIETLNGISLSMTDLPSTQILDSLFSAIKYLRESHPVAENSRALKIISDLLPYTIQLFANM